VSSEDVASRFLREGLELNGRSLRIRFFDPAREGLPSERLFVNRIPAATTAEVLTSAFAEFAPDAAVTEVRILKKTGPTRDAIVTFASVKDAMRAFRLGFVKIDGFNSKLRYFVESPRTFVCLGDCRFSEAEIRAGLVESNMVATSLTIQRGVARVYLRDTYTDEQLETAIRINGEVVKFARARLPADGTRPSVDVGTVVTGTTQAAQNIEGQDVISRGGEKLDESIAPGATASLHVFGIPATRPDTVVIAAVQAQTGIRPVSILRPFKKRFVFINFADVASAEKAKSKLFKFEGRALEIRFAWPKHGARERN
jgi:hypothetical protein